MEELKKIWKTCFDDDDAYIDFYFSQRYKPANTLVHYEAGHAVAMLTLLPITVAAPLESLRGHYVYAVATLPEFRGRGISSALAVDADNYMQDAGDDVAVVVPATKRLFDFYEQQGFSTAFFRRVVSFRMDEIEEARAAEGIQLNNIEQFYNLRERYFDTGFFVRWDKEALQYATDECRISGGEVYYFSEAGGEGYIIAEPADDVVVVKETAIPPALARAVLAFLKKSYSSYREIQCRLPLNSLLWKGRGAVEPVAMLKWFIPPHERPSIADAYVGLLKD